MEDKKDECARMREEIQDYIREYTREIKLKEILIKNFIPEEEVTSDRRFTAYPMWSSFSVPAAPPC